jgi:peptidoglycan/LPS O-acetylase OafA/YrhL
LDAPARRKYSSLAAWSGSFRSIGWTTSAILLVEVLMRHGSLDRAGTSTMAAVASFFFIPRAQPNGTISTLHAVGWTLNYEMLFYCLFAAVVGLPRATRWSS